MTERRPDLPPMSLGDLLVYFQGVYETTVLIKGRAAKLGADGRPVLRDIGQFQKMVRGYLESLQQTAALHEQGQASVSGSSHS